MDSNRSKDEDDVRTLLRTYAEAAVVQGQASFAGDYKTANAKYDILVNICCRLRELGSEAQMCLLELMNHADPNVRLWSATHALEFAPERGEAALRELVNRELRLVSFAAELTLREWTEGRLEFPRGPHGEKEETL